MGNRSNDIAKQESYLIILQSMLSSTGIMWTGIILLEQHIAFLLWEQQHEWVEQCFRCTWHCSTFSPQTPKATKTFNLRHFTPWWRGLNLCIMGNYTLKMSLPRSLMHTNGHHWDTTEYQVTFCDIKAWLEACLPIVLL